MSTSPFTYPAIEYRPWPEQIALQEAKLQELMAYLQERSPFYRRHFAAHGIDPGQICTVQDLTRIPPIGKDELHRHPDDFLCIPPDQVAEYTATSGTLGQPVSIALSAGDLQRLAYNEALSFALMGVGAGDKVQLMLTLDRQFMAGMAYYLGVQQAGAAAIRTGPGLPDLQWNTAKRLGATAAVAVPSFLLRMGNALREKGVDPASSSLQAALCIGESIRQPDGSPNALATALQKVWPLRLHSTYAATEMQTAFTECVHGCGGHLHPELLILEILSEDGTVVDPGEWGEVTITTLGVEGMPLLRYRTGDICRLDVSPCACGLHSPRLSAVKGRRQQMIKYRGTTLYPPALFDLLNRAEAVQDYAVEVRRDAFGNDDLIIHLHTALPVDACEAGLRPYLQAGLRVMPTLQYHSSTEMQAMLFPAHSRKAVRFIDNRSGSV